MKEKKRALRASVKISPSSEAGDPLYTLIERLPAFEAAGTVALFCSLPGEPSTAPMLDRWQGLKRLALPAIVDGGMVFREYSGPGCLCEGAFGIREPHEGREIPPGEIDLMLVPGVAFDTARHRLGRGGGFYDRYLSRPEVSHIYKLGVCLPHGLVPEVPTEPHDVIMDEIVVGI